MLKYFLLLIFSFSSLANEHENKTNIRLLKPHQSKDLDTGIYNRLYHFISTNLSSKHTFEIITVPRKRLAHSIFNSVDSTNNNCGMQAKGRTKENSIISASKVIYARSHIPGVFTKQNTKRLQPHLLEDGSFDIHAAMGDASLSWALTYNFGFLFPQHEREKKTEIINSKPRFLIIHHDSSNKALYQLIVMGRRDIAFSTLTSFRRYTNLLNLNKKLKFYTNKYLSEISFKDPLVLIMYCNNKELNNSFIKSLNELMDSARGTQKFANYIFTHPNLPEVFKQQTQKHSKQLRLGTYDTHYPQDQRSSLSSQRKFVIPEDTF